MSNLLNQLNAALSPRYQLDRELGSGGMARVYLAADLPHGRRVAIKVLHPELAGAVGQDRFLQEIRFASELAHPHILPLLDSGSARVGDSVLPYYVMPFVVGETLRAKLLREKQLPVDEALKITHDVATALSYAHAHGVVHRDIKPENIMLVGKEAVVADFGIARAIDRAAEGEVITSAGLAVGTPAYMSPEQWTSTSEVDGRSDIYSLGCVLYEMLGGDPPFTGSSANAIGARHRADPVPPLRTIRPSIPLSIEAVVLRALEKIPADRFRTAEQLAIALGQQHTPSERTPLEHSVGQNPVPIQVTTVETPHPPRSAGRRTWRTGLGVSLLILAGLVVWWVISEARWFGKQVRYSDTPEWSAWRGWTGEFFPVFALDDSTLLTTVLGGDAAQLFDGERWTSLPVPNSFRLLRYVGPVPGGHLLAVRRETQPSGPTIQYWWLRPARSGFVKEAAISFPLPDDQVSPHWWSDGQDLVVWLDAIRHFDDSVLVREPTGTTGGISRVWGIHSRRRFAIPSAGRPLLEFDGVSWNQVPAIDSQEGILPTFIAGASFPDGGTAVVGLECTGLPSCRPFLLEQATESAPWRRIPIGESLGIPIAMRPDTGASCDLSQFAPIDIAGQSRRDFYVWGLWSTCYAGLEQLETGCPPRQPCTWQVTNGRLVPIPELVGKLVQSMGFQNGVPLALLNDGTLWQKTEDRWRAVSRVPGLPGRRVGASTRMIVRQTGTTLRYEPGHADGESPFRVRVMDSIPFSVQQGNQPARLVVRNLRAGLLGADGEVLVSDCRREEGATSGTGPPRGALRCDPWRRLAAERMRDLDLLPDGTPIGVSTDGRIVTWKSSTATPENLPSQLREEALWGITVSDQGRALAISSRLVIERDPAGRWEVIRRVNAPVTPQGRFLVLPGGDLVIVERSIQVWDRQGDSLPAAVLYRPPLGEDQLGALHALPDGRLVAGLANPEDPLVGGRLMVWAAPARTNRSQLVQLPISMDITDLADDGRFLHVVGRGGTVMIPLASLPFSSPPSR